MAADPNPSYPFRAQAKSPVSWAPEMKRFILMRAPDEVEAIQQIINVTPSHLLCLNNWKIASFIV